jgi:hypothetical protein
VAQHPYPGQAPPAIGQDPAQVLSATPVEHRLDAEAAAVRAGFADALHDALDAGPLADEANRIAVGHALAESIAHDDSLREPGRHRVVVRVGRPESFGWAVRAAKVAADLSRRRVGVALGDGPVIVALCPGPAGC